jgi:hypothetical protein
VHGVCHALLSAGRNPAGNSAPGRCRVARGVVEKLLALGEHIVAVARADKLGVVMVPRW